MHATPKKTDHGGREGADIVATSQRRGRRALPARTTALLLIDVINDLAFDGSETLVAQAEAMAVRLARLKRRALAANVPVVYVNDNFGQWRSDLQQTVRHCTAATSPGRGVASRLRPGKADYFVLKPKHSGFYGTTLDTLLESLGTRSVVVTGIAGNICVLFTANDAYMRKLRVLVPSDCVVSNTATLNEAALEQMRTVLKADTRPSPALTFTATPRRRRRGRGPVA